MLGDKNNPLRPSSLLRLIQCPKSFMAALELERQSKAAADTGSLLHAAVEAYHRSKNNKKKGEAALQDKLSDFPKADTKKAAKWYAQYTEDKKNQTAVVTHLEHEVQLKLPPHPLDTTKQPVYIKGTLDQVRNNEVWDIKTSSVKQIHEVMHDYLYQQAAYLLAARQTIGDHIQHGGLIWIPSYEKRYSNPFQKLPLDVELAEQLMLAVTERVALIRQGEVAVTPSDVACSWCPINPWPKCLSFGETK